MYMTILMVVIFALGLMALFNSRFSYLWKGITFGAAMISLIFLFFLMCHSATSRDARIKNQERYQDLLLYQTVVNQTEDEYVRFDFYNKVQEWNKEYEDKQAAKEDPWISWLEEFFDEYENTGVIDFALNGVGGYIDGD